MVAHEVVDACAVVSPSVQPIQRREVTDDDRRSHEDGFSASDSSDVPSSGRYLSATIAEPSRFQPATRGTCAVHASRRERRERSARRARSPRGCRTPRSVQRSHRSQRQPRRARSSGLSSRGASWLTLGEIGVLAHAASSSVASSASATARRAASSPTRSQAIQMKARHASMSNSRGILKQEAQGDQPLLKRRQHDRPPAG